MPATPVIALAKDTMEKAIGHIQKEFRLVRTGRATPALVEGLPVNAYGSQTPLKSCANISAPEARQLVVKPFDVSLLKEIEKALLASDLGVNPQNDGKLIRLNFPPTTEERRKKTSQEVKAKGEAAKVTIRNARRDALKSLEELNKASKISDDDLKRRKDEVQNILKDYEKKIDAEVEKKNKEVMEI